ncbi:MAG TPA: hypothetical protein VIC30_07015 [Orrella sp.]
MKRKAKDDGVDQVRKRSSTAPRDSREPGCPEWCYQTLNLLSMSWQSVEIDVERITEHYLELCATKAWLKIPVHAPYGTEQEMIKQELGIEEGDFYDALRKKVTEQQIEARQVEILAIDNEAGIPIRESAEKLGLSKSKAHRMLSQKSSVHTKNGTKPKRELKQYKISQYTKPATAAQKIRETFGDDYALELASLLYGQSTGYNHSIGCDVDPSGGVNDDQDSAMPSARARIRD